MTAAYLTYIITTHTRPLGESNDYQFERAVVKIQENIPAKTMAQLNRSGRMDSATDGRRRPIVKQTDRHMWRYRLFQGIRERRGYDSMVRQGLVPLSKAAMAQMEDELAHVRAFHALKVRPRPSNNLPRLAEYIERTEATVNDFLRLRQDGQVAR